MKCISLREQKRQQGETNPAKGLSSSDDDDDDDNDSIEDSSVYKQGPNYVRRCIVRAAQLCKLA